MPPKQYTGLLSGPPSCVVRTLLTWQVSRSVPGRQNANPAWIEGQYDIWFDWIEEIPPIGEPDADLEIEWNPGYVWGATRTGPLDYNHLYDENPYYLPPHEEPHEENEEYWWQKFAWTANWFLQGILITLLENQNFINYENWIWPDDHYVMDYFNLGWDADALAAQNLVYADPDVQKDRATITER